MITPKEIEKLANLARIQITDEEKSQFGSEIDSILTYVALIKKADVSMERSQSVGNVKNILREDTHPHESGKDTEKLLAEAPHREGDYFKVKKIL